MSTTRRELLRLGLGGSTLLACGTTVPTFLAQSANALSALPDRKVDGRILVVIQLDGGNDGLNTVVPHLDDAYNRNRPTLRLNGTQLKRIDDRVGLHPALDDFARLSEKGRLAIVQSVGYPNPNRSHSESMAIWNTAQLDPGLQTPGWLSRAVESSKPIQARSDAPALQVGDEALSQALRGSSQPIPCLARPEQFQRRLGPLDHSTGRQQRDALNRVVQGSEMSDNPLLQFVARSTILSYVSSARLEEVLHNESGATGYPSNYELARRLKLIAQLIRAEVSTPIYYVQTGSFDTHANQLDTHAALLRQLGRSLGAFLADLERNGLADRVAVLVFSEFGRRLHENASEGTDHGTAAPVFLLGHPVSGGLHGPYPDLDHLEDGDPKHAIDFRRVYASVLEHWLKISANPILGGSFETLPLFKS